MNSPILVRTEVVSSRSSTCSSRLRLCFALVLLALGLVCFLPLRAIRAQVHLPDGGEDNVGTNSTGIIDALDVISNLESERVIYSFKGGNDGAGPNDLIADQSGNLYGTTFDGGSPAGAGTVFRLSPPNEQGGAWTKTILYGFSFARLLNGIGPKAGLVMDSSGNLFGSTWLGGPSGGGLVFELSPPAREDEGWSYRILYDFSALNDGSSPEAPLAMDAKGNLYGTTASGGTGGCAGGCGIVFKLTPPSESSGVWTETILYDFPGTFPGNGGTVSGVTLDAGGAVYGTTTVGGTQQCGTVFRLSPPKDPGRTQRWTHTVLYSFQGGSDGLVPSANVEFNDSGELYGVTAYGGNSINCYGVSCGTVFKLTPTPSGPWTHSVLYTFNGGTDGGDPMSSVVFDAKGNLYGTTLIGGDPNCGSVGCGTVYRLHPKSGKETILNRFVGGDDGVGPGGVILGEENTLYGVAALGRDEAGVVFATSPRPRHSAESR